MEKYVLIWDQGEGSEEVTAADIVKGRTLGKTVWAEKTTTKILGGLMGLRVQHRRRLGEGGLDGKMDTMRYPGHALFRVTLKSPSVHRNDILISVLRTTHKLYSMENSGSQRKADV